MKQVPEQGADGEALRQAMNELMERVREDAQARERLLAQDPQAAERAARLRILLNEAKRRLEHADQPTPHGTDEPAAGS